MNDVEEVVVFLVSQLPHEGIGDTGLRAAAPMIADLLVENLASDGEVLRRDVPRVLEELFEGREARLRAGLTQSELAERTGRERSVIARWEQGAVSPSIWICRSGQTIPIPECSPAMEF